MQDKVVCVCRKPVLYITHECQVRTLFGFTLPGSGFVIPEGCLDTSAAFPV